MRAEQQASGHATRNIDDVLAMEDAAVPPQSWLGRMASWTGDIAGTPGFIGFHLVWFALWIVANKGLMPGLPVFDEYPYSVLHLLLVMEAVLLTSSVLIRQNRAAELAEQRSHLDLQVNLLAERESTKTLHILERMSKALGIEHQVMDDEARALGHDTTVTGLADKLRERQEDRAD